MAWVNQVYKRKLTTLTIKIPDTSGIVKKTDYNAKLSEIGSKIPTTLGLATTAALTAVENNIPNVINLLKKQIITQKYQILKVNILLRLIITHLRII